VPVAPAHLERAFAVAAHELAAHRGVRATGHLLHLHVFLPSGNSIIDTVVRQCLACQTKGGEEKPQRHTYRTVVSGFPFQRLSIDFVGPLKKTSRGNTVILTVKDTFTKWVEAFALPRATAESVATTLTNEIFARFGYPDEIHSDRGSQFTSHLITQLAELIGVHITWTPAYHPQSNPVERAHRDLKAGLRAALETVGGDEWDTCLPQVLFAFRTSPARGTGISPFHALFGRHPNVPLGILEAPPRMGRPLADYVVDLQARMEAVHRWARENLVKEVHRQQRAYSSMPRSFEPGDRVWLYAPQTRVERGDRKLLRSWTGPWIVRRAYNGGVLYDIEDEVTRTCRSATQVRHVVRLAGDALGMHIASLLCDEQLGESLPGHELDPSFLPHAQALQRLAAGQLDAVLTTQRLRHRDRRQGLIEHPIGDLVLAAVVPQKHPMWDLRREQLGELLAGDWTHWDQLGGPNNSIETLALPDDDPVWSCAMESLFAGKKLAPHVQRCTNEDVLQIILTRKPMAIGLLPLGTFRSDLDLRVLSINGTQPSPHMVRSGKYPLRVRCALVVRRDAQLPVLRFVSYATGNEARASLATLLTPAH
jgi:transposase InsO family protein